MLDRKPVKFTMLYIMFLFLLSPGEFDVETLSIG